MKRRGDKSQVSIVLRTGEQNQLWQYLNLMRVSNWRNVASWGHLNKQIQTIKFPPQTSKRERERERDWRNKKMGNNTDAFRIHWIFTPSKLGGRTGESISLNGYARPWNIYIYIYLYIWFLFCFFNWWMECSKFPALTCFIQTRVIVRREAAETILQCETRSARYVAVPFVKSREYHNLNQFHVDPNAETSGTNIRGTNIQLRQSPTAVTR